MPCQAAAEMSVETDPLEAAARLIKAGKIAEAQEILHPFIRAQPQNVDAWLLETETWNSAGKIRVLEICLEHNPGNPRAQQALKELLTAQQERLARQRNAMASAADTRPRRTRPAESDLPLSERLDQLTRELKLARQAMEQASQNFNRLQAEVDELRQELVRPEPDSPVPPA